MVTVNYLDKEKEEIEANGKPAEEKKVINWCEYFFVRITVVEDTKQNKVQYKVSKIYKYLKIKLIFFFWLLVKFKDCLIGFLFTITGFDSFHDDDDDDDAEILN